MKGLWHVIYKRLSRTHTVESCEICKKALREEFYTELKRGAGVILQVPDKPGLNPFDDFRR